MLLFFLTLYVQTCPDDKSCHKILSLNIFLAMKFYILMI